MLGPGRIRSLRALFVRSNGLYQAHPRAWISGGEGRLVLNTGSVQTVALLALDGSEPERLESLEVPSHVKPKLTGQLEHRVEVSFTGFILELV